VKHLLSAVATIAFAAGMFTPRAGAQIKIDPAPSSTAQFITITATAGAGLEGRPIQIYISKTADTCTAANVANGSANAVAIVPHTSYSVQPGGITTVAIVTGVLLSDDFVCVVIQSAAGATFASQPVQISAPAPAGGGTVTINPAPSTTDQFITVVAPAGMAGADIEIYIAATQPACTTAASKMNLEPHTPHEVLPDGTTAIAIVKGKLTSGNWVCAVVTVKGSAPVVSTAVQVKAPGAVPVSEVEFDPPQPTIKDPSLVVVTPGYLADGTLTILTSNTAEACAKSTTTLGTADTPITGQRTTVAITPGTLKQGYYLCVTVKDANGKTATNRPVAVLPGCDHHDAYSDCTYEFTLMGGIEQSGLSAQNSITNGFYDLFIRRPVDSKWLGVWFRSRYLGSPSTSSTSNVVAAATNPAGTVTASNLPQSVTAVDYILGFTLGKRLEWGSPSGRLTITPAAGFGATTPLSANTTVNAFQVPQFGTNECDQLQKRFTTDKGYTPPLPGSGYYKDSTGAIVQGCVVQPPGNSTMTSATNPGTQITAIAFSNEDRTNFLLKWGAGVRLIDRYTPTCITTTGCPRMRADFSIGQDQAITAGYMRRLVLKADAVIPIFSTGTYFFASSANRLAPNNTLSPLILNPVTVNSGNSSACATPSSSIVCVPSPSVFVLPYKQPNRDYYRIGIGIDAVKLLSKLFNPPAS
jgi:hypothetical protein